MLKAKIINKVIALVVAIHGIRWNYQFHSKTILLALKWVYKKFSIQIQYQTKS